MNTIKRLLIPMIFAVVIGVSFGISQYATAQNAEAKRNFVINLTVGKEDLHKATMALQMAQHALDDGREVTIFANVRAPELFTKQLSSDVKMKGSDDSIAKMRDDLIKKGAKVILCPFCSKAQGVKKEDLASGVEFASRDSLFSKLDDKTIVFSY